jgi:hypothetical protein
MALSGEEYEEWKRRRASDVINLLEKELKTSKDLGSILTKEECLLIKKILEKHCEFEIQEFEFTLIESNYRRIKDE